MSRHRLEQLLALLCNLWREVWWELEPSARRLRLYGLIDIINARLSRAMEETCAAGSSSWLRLSDSASSLPGSWADGRTTSRTRHV